MARTVSKYCRFLIGDTGDVIRHIPVDSINGLGLTYDEVTYAAFIDTIKGALSNLANFSITITGPFDNTAAAASPSLSGSHTVLSALNGVNTPRMLDIQFGMGTTWTNGAPQFGITKSATAGVIVTDYQVIPSANGEVKYSAKISMFAGSTSPDWGTAAES